MKLLRIFRIFRKAMLKMSTFLLTLVFKNALLQLNSLIARLINSVLASLVPNLLHTTYGKCQTFCIQLMVSAKPSAYNLWYTTSKPNFAKIIWWWQSECRDEWTPDSIIKFGCDVKIRSIHEEEVSDMCVGSLIIRCNPNWCVTFSVASPSKLVLSWQKQLLDLALKSPIATTKNGSFAPNFLDLIQGFQ